MANSPVISALFRASNNLHANGGQLSLVLPGDMHGTIRSLFEIMSLDRLIPTHATRVAAISYLETAQPTTDAPTTMRLRSLSEIIDHSLPDADDQRQAS